MFKKRIEDISHADIQELVVNKVMEGRQLDYKQKMPGSGDEEKRDFLTDVSAFANANGGLFLFGIPEEQENGKNTGIPASCDGLPGLNLDAERLRLESCIRDGISPRIQGIRIEAVPGFKNGPVMLLRVPKSLAGPHMVTFKNLSRFFVRTNAGNSQMDVAELRAAFINSEALPERVRKFRAERVSAILADETPIRFETPNRVVIHVIPLEGFGQIGQVDLSEVLEGRVKCEPLVGSGYPPRFNLDGVVSVDDAGKKLFGYSLIFRDGSIEAVDAYLLRPEPNGDAILASIELERHVRARMIDYRKALAALNVLGPLAIFLSLLNVRDFRLTHPFRGHVTRTPLIDRDHLLFPEIVINEPETDIDKALRPLFDTVWQASGYPRCWNYDDEGNWGRRP